MQRTDNARVWQPRADLHGLLAGDAILDIKESSDGRLIPVVAGRMVLTDNGRAIRGVVIRCPYCGDEHLHGAGSRPGRASGHRVSHCCSPLHPFDAGYDIRVPLEEEEAAWAGRSAGAHCRSEDSLNNGDVIVDEA